MPSPYDHGYTQHHGIPPGTRRCILPAVLQSACVDGTTNSSGTTCVSSQGGLQYKQIQVTLKLGFFHHREHCILDRMQKRIGDLIGGVLGSTVCLC